MEVQVQWLEEPDSKEGAKRGPPRLPGAPAIPPMPVAAPAVEAQAAGTNKTMEVDPRWLEQVEERRAQKKAQAAKPPAAPARKPPIPRED